MGQWGQKTLRTRLWGQTTLRTKYIWNFIISRTLQITDIPKFWQIISNKICTFPKQKPSKCTFPNPAPEGRPETLQMTYIPKFWQQISNKICTFPKQKPSKLHTFSNPAPEGRPETLQITYIPKVLASYIQYFLIFWNLEFVLKVACPQSRIVLKVACPQSRVLNVLSSTSFVLIVP